MTSDSHLAYLTRNLTLARMEHSLGVMRVMEALAPIYDLDPTAARIAGLVHDAGKELPMAQMVAIAQTMHFPLDEPGNRDPLYLHGPCSAYIAQHEMGINDPLILEAIFRHSYAGNGPVHSTVFCWSLRFADMLEPSRDWTDLRELLHPLAFSGRMAEAALALMNWLFPFLERIGVPPHPNEWMLQHRLAQLCASGVTEVPHDQLPV
jgi:predicted HD superfamily hydrolase involved in NAD metabolism